MSSWLERRTSHELYDYACGRLREMRRQLLFGEPQFRFIAENALKAIEEIKAINPHLMECAARSMSARFDDDHA
jgi:hypothetical protein